MLVKVETLELALELYDAGLLRWYDGDVWSRAHHYGKPEQMHVGSGTFVELEE